MALGSQNSGNISRIWQYLCAFERWHIIELKKKVVILVYSIKSYCVLKMNKNKKKNWYISKFYHKKGKNGIQVAKKICDVYGHDAVSVCVAQS